ncbi:MAG: HupE/UreJ family protein [Acidobacteria bacterium]|nr:HupE/UreJ family protein [Acidobacteriota bacterium]
MIARRLVLLSLATCGWLVCGVTVAAHPVPFSYMDVRLAPAALDVTVVLHIYDVAHDLDIAPMERLLDPDAARAQTAAIAGLLDRRLRILVDGRPLTGAWTGVEVLTDRQSLRLRVRTILDAPPGVVTIDGRLFPYDPQHQTFINIYDGDGLIQAMINQATPRFEYFAGTRHGTVAVVGRFVPLGARHIVIGPDHVLFLVGLMLLGGTLGRLILIVTAFTLAHSLTLSLAALSLVAIPARVIEPAIALSIIYVGVDNLLVRDGGRDTRVWMAFAFGLIHGFGFANVLQEMHLPARALGWSLFSFNLGVEAGQLAIVVPVAAALAALRARRAVAARGLATAGSVAIILAGSYWFVQRIVYSGGA